MLIYEAGCIGHYQNINELEKATEWRRIATEKLNVYNIKTFDPTINFIKNTYYPTKGVIYQNYHYLKNSDLMLLNLDCLEKSPGSLYEIFTFFNARKPIVSFGKSDIYFHPHVNEAITINFPKLENALEYIISMYIQ